MLVPLQGAAARYLCPRAFWSLGVVPLEGTAAHTYLLLPGVYAGVILLMSVILYFPNKWGSYFNYKLGCWCRTVLLQHASVRARLLQITKNDWICYLGSMLT